MLPRIITAVIGAGLAVLASFGVIAAGSQHPSPVTKPLVVYGTR